MSTLFLERVKDFEIYLDLGDPGARAVQMI